MAYRQHENCERAVRVEEGRRAWFDGWTEGVIWTLAKTVRVLREAGHPEAVGWSVIQHASSGHASADGESHAELLARASPPSKSPDAS